MKEDSKVEIQYFTFFFLHFLSFPHFKLCDLSVAKSLCCGFLCNFTKFLNHLCSKYLMSNKTVCQISAGITVDKIKMYRMIREHVLQRLCCMDGWMDLDLSLPT